MQLQSQACETRLLCHLHASCIGQGPYDVLACFAGCTWHLTDTWVLALIQAPSWASILWTHQYLCRRQWNRQILEQDCLVETWARRAEAEEPQRQEERNLLRWEHPFEWAWRKLGIAYHSPLLVMDEAAALVAASSHSPPSVEATLRPDRRC